MKYFVYIIFNAKYNKFYIGQTYNLTKRLLEHNQHLSKYTAKYDGEWTLVFNENFSTRAEAMKREKFLKAQKNRDFYIKLTRDA
ncbi:MAG: GIY-YIG nuclease family protein [Patescibacteria group bacterium]|nr:GIY-YIG nuclease family protein [Patescibacteria group bacterium]MDD5294488.1 GIY-YIG nuclease family protein [Patescibacteria group bacterium]MDD5554330.1 GIY-YIG nuclease family protein [Patescibacteria group bacterium]